jgi:hypothetical protein
MPLATAGTRAEQEIPSDPWSLTHDKAEFDLLKAQREHATQPATIMQL